MKNKLSAMSLVMVIILALTSVPTFSHNIGDVIGYSLTTDIVATINGYDIPSYNVDGYTYIIVEDLRHYGFTVIYDDSTRTLSVSRDPAKTYVTKTYVKSFVFPGEVGQRAHSLLYTDIKTYLDGKYIDSYNIDGQTIIRFDALSLYDNVSYDNDKREISLALSGLNYNPTPVDRNKAAADAIERTEGKAWRSKNANGSWGGEELYIKKIENGNVTFSFNVYRLMGLDATGKIGRDGSITFYSNDYNSMSGRIRFLSEDNVVLEITASNFSYIEAGTTYELYKTTETLFGPY